MSIILRNGGWRQQKLSLVEHLCLKDSLLDFDRLNTDPRGHSFLNHADKCVLIRAICHVGQSAHAGHNGHLELCLVALKIST